MDEMTSDERRRLGEMVRQVRTERFGTKLAAYTAVGVNSATWDRIESGASVKDYSLRTVIAALWPGAGGDWRKVPGVRAFEEPSLSSFADDAHEDPDSTAGVWQSIAELQKRVEMLERRMYASGDPGVSVDDYVLAARDDDDDLEAEAQQDEA